jgi:hypothetical protein
MGSQGLPGTAGAKGDTGAAGANGSNGTNGTNGTAGTNGQNYYALDATGKILGPVVGHYGNAIDVILNNIVWSFDNSFYNLNNTATGSSNNAYADASCSVPYLQVLIGGVPNPQGMIIDWGSNYSFDSTDKAFQASGGQVSWTGKTIYRWRETGPPYISTCTVMSDSDKTREALTYVLYSQTEVTKPTYTAPLTIVAR